MSRILILYLGGLTLRFLVFAAVGALLAFRVRSVAARHSIWTAVLSCLLLMPLADALLPAALVPDQAPEIVLPVQTFVAVPTNIEVQPAGTVSAVPAPVSRDWWQAAIFVWMVVAAGFLCRLFVAFSAIQRVKREGLPVFSEAWDDAKASHRLRFRTPALRESAAVTVPLTAGLWQPILLLPSNWRDWDPWKMRAVLAHELTHVRRMDWATAVTASIARSVFWFNPLVWWLERHLSSLAEQASDEASVQATGDAPRYAEALLQFASTARNGNRWIGGVAMAQYKISFRIERVLGLRQAGSGVLSKAGWLTVCVLAISALYVSAAAQSLTRTELPSLSAAELIGAIQQSLPLPELALVSAPAVPEAGPPQTPTPAPTPTSINPDLITEIRLILSPVDAMLGRSHDYIFALTGIQDRSLRFELSRGETLGYSCSDCSFLVWEGGAGTRPGNTDPGVAFRLSADAKRVTATCRATACRVNSVATGLRTLKDSETFEFAVPEQAAASSTGSTLRCISVFGNVKADGTPLTAADCPGGVAVMPPYPVYFSVSR